MEFGPEMDPNNGIAAFLRRASASISSAEMNQNLMATRSTRSLRKFSIREICEFTDLNRGQVEGLLQHPDAPKGEQRGREVVFSADDLMRLRILRATQRAGTTQTIFWRGPKDPLPVITVGSQKGGSGKSLTACNLALYAHIFFGLRVGVIDADPQATASLYFADDKISIGTIDTPTFTNFMGMQEPGEPIVMHDPEALDTFWRPTTWPGVRLMPGGPSIQEGDINLFFHFKNPAPGVPMFHELLRSALERHEEAYRPTLSPQDICPNGKFDEELYERALGEAFDLIVIDCAPALSLTMLNTIVAGTSLIVPTPVRGWDLATVKAYTSSASDLIGFLQDEKQLEFAKLPSFVLPTIVSQQTTTDLMVLRSMMDHDPEIICPVFYNRSEAVANAAEHYNSLYEYVPPKGKKKSTDNFLRNANAVGDAILSRCVPRLPSRGFANDFIKDTYGGAIPAWTKGRRTRRKKK